MLGMNNIYFPTDHCDVHFYADDHFFFFFFKCGDICTYKEPKVHRGSAVIQR